MRYLSAFLTLTTFLISMFHSGVNAELVAHWDFNEGSGTFLNDKSGNENHGLISGATWVDGIAGKALSFDGDGDFVNMGDPVSGDLDFGENSFSYSFWAFSHLCDGIAVSKYKYSPGNGGYWFWFKYSTGEIYATLGDGDTAVVVLSSYPESLRDIIKWVFYSVIIDRTNQKMKLFINGSLMDSVDILSVVNTSTDNDFIVGNDYTLSDSRFFSGFIDEIRLYDHALTETEIQDLYTEFDEDEDGCGSCGSGTGLAFIPPIGFKLASMVKRRKKWWHKFFKRLKA